jgi:hypothetical protein
MFHFPTMLFKRRPEQAGQDDMDECHVGHRCQRCGHGIDNDGDGNCQFCWDIPEGDGRLLPIHQGAAGLAALLPEDAGRRACVADPGTTDGGLQFKGMTVYAPKWPYDLDYEVQANKERQALRNHWGY